MTLVSRYDSYPETVREMERAALSRLQEARVLLYAGQWDGSIYLLGYAGEMLLKTAYCRVDPAVTGTYPVDSRIFPARRRWQVTWGGPLPSGHNILFLSLSLEDERVAQGKGHLSAATGRLFNTAVNRISDLWDVKMRYRRKGVATSGEASQMFDDVKWLRDNHSVLWR